MSLPASDTFTGTTGVALPTYSANWTINYGAPSAPANGFVIAATNMVKSDGPSGGETGARWNADAFPNDQYAFITWAASGSGGGGAAVRIQTGTGGDYYGYYGENGGRKMFTMIAGSWTQKGSSGSQPAVNDVLRVEAVGTTLTAKLNGATDTAVGSSGTFTDSTFTTGYAGIAGWGTGSTPALDNWEGGSLATGSASVSPSVSPSASVSPSVSLSPSPSAAGEMGWTANTTFRAKGGVRYIPDLN